MFDFDKVPLPDYTRAEDTINSVTHAVGVPMTFVFDFLLLKKLDYNPTGMQTAALIIYSVCMIVLYFGSAYYHGLKPSRLKKIARVLDHSNIYLMITGTLTVFNLIATANYAKTLSVVLTAAMCAIAAVGIFFTVRDLHRFRKVQMAMYMIMGWSVIISIVPIVKNGGEAGKTLVVYILAGGLLYTVGAIFYGVGKKIRYIHAVFHVFIVAASAVQFVGFYNYL